MNTRVNPPQKPPTILRHVLFCVGFVVAVLAAMPMTLIFAMNECQLNPTQEMIDECFARNSLGGKVYLGTVVAVALLAVVLHVRCSRWTWLALIMIPIAPVLSIFAMSKLMT